MRCITCQLDLRMLEIPFLKTSVLKKCNFLIKDAPGLSYRDCLWWSASWTPFSNKINGKHPWANRRQRINQSERVLCFSYVINSSICPSRGNKNNVYFDSPNFQPYQWLMPHRRAHNPEACLLMDCFHKHNSLVALGVIWLTGICHPVRHKEASFENRILHIM